MNMKLNVKKFAFLGIALSGIYLVGCVPLYPKEDVKRSEIEKVAMAVLDADELVSIKEVELNKTDKKKNSKKDLEVILNLPHSAENIALDNALLKSTNIMNILEDNFKDNLNNYKFVINTNQFDVYGNEQKIKILEISVKNEEVEKIKFENFDYNNLEELAEIRKFNYLKEDSEKTSSEKSDVKREESSSANKQKQSLDEKMLELV